MSEKQIFALFGQFWRDLQQPEFYWEVLALGGILAFSWWLSFRLRKQENLYRKSGQSALRAFGVGSVKRISFPVVALIFVLIVALVRPFDGCIDRIDARGQAHPVCPA